mgnify:CR=1 FL=1
MRPLNYAKYIATTSSLRELAKVAAEMAWDVTEGMGIECNCPSVKDKDGNWQEGCTGGCTHSQIIALADSLKRISAGGGDTTTDEQDRS